MYYFCLQGFEALTPNLLRYVHEWIIAVEMYACIISVFRILKP